MVDKLLAALSLLMLVAFLAVVVVFVREVALTIVILLGIALAAYDIWTSSRPSAEAARGQKG